MRDIRRRARQVAPQFLSACVMVYFLYHAIQGDRGFLAWLNLYLRQIKADGTADALYRRWFTPSGPAGAGEGG